LPWRVLLSKAKNLLLIERSLSLFGKMLAIGFLGCRLEMTLRHSLPLEGTAYSGSRLVPRFTGLGRDDGFSDGFLGAVSGNTKPLRQVMQGECRKQILAWNL